MKLNLLAEKCGYKVYGDKNVEITGIAFDSRKVKDGYLFVCLNGGSVNGADYINEAIMNGAIAILNNEQIECNVSLMVDADTRFALAKVCAEFFNRPDEKLKSIAVTGTNGKTSTVNFLADLLGRDRCGIIGTNGYYSGDKLIGQGMTTPDPVELYSLLDTFVKDDREFLLFEASAHSIFYKKIDCLKIDAALFLNCTRDHLDFFKDFSEYEKTKIKLFEREDIKIKIVNVDDETGKKIAGSNKVLSFSCNKCADFSVKADNQKDKIKYEIKSKEYSLEVTPNLYGKFNVYNSGMALACLMTLGLDKKYLIKAVNNLKEVAGRFNIVERCGRKFIIDYAHTPDGLENLLSCCKAIKRNALITVFGCGGDRDKGKRPIMGQVACKYSDVVILTSDNPRNEDPLKIINEIKEGTDGSIPVIEIENREQAIIYAAKISRKGDVIAVCGKGAENYMEKNGIKTPFDDKLIIKNLPEEGIGDNE